MITTRSSTREDAEAIAACVDAVSRERRYLGNTSGFTAEQTRAFIASLSESGGIQIIVVADTQIVGWCDVTPFPFEGMRHVGRLGMGLLPSFRGQGLGRRLVREALNLVFAKTLQRVELEVFASNKIAIGLYEQEGFVMEGRKRFARFLDGAEDDILIMGCLREEWLRSRANNAAVDNAATASRLTIDSHRLGLPGSERWDA
jgi:RimJ/RimL family protein N-acetyltransferase